ESTGKGVLLPRSTTGQISAMTSVPTGMLVFNTTDSTIYLRRDTGWVALVVSQLGVNPTLRPPSPTASDVFALMPGDNPAPIPSFAPINFPQTSVISGGIARLSASLLQLQGSGSYSISYVVSVNEPAQLGLFVNGSLLANSVAGRSTFNTQIASTSIVNVVGAATVELRNVSGVAITLTPFAGGPNPVAAHLSIIKVL
ncbi:MAG: hypothetical protein ABIQ56_00940, partial [Chitinophagaceae bacterium]